MRFILLALGLAGVCLAEPTAAAIASEIRHAGLDPEACYRVRELHFSKEDVRIYLTEGYLIFAKPVQGRRMGAIFTADAEGGDAEILVMPPSKDERASLARFTGTPNLSEHFRAGVMVFSDSTAVDLLKQIEESGMSRAADIGALLAENWNSVLTNLFSSFEVKLVRDVLSPAGGGFFYTALTGATLGNFDLICEPRARDQIVVGQVANREGRLYFDVWTRFRSRSLRGVTRAAPRNEFDLEDFRIDAKVGADLAVSGTTRLKLSAKSDSERVFVFDISRRVRVTAATIDGEPAEVFQRESLRASALRGGDNDAFLLVAPKPLSAGRQYEVAFTHDGNVVRSAGGGVFFVEARTNWYPHRNHQFAVYDLTFRYPKELSLVATGEVVEDREEGLDRITRRKTESPIRMAGFNLGMYEKAEAVRGPYRVEVYANRRLEAALQPKPRDIVIAPPSPFTRPQQRRQPPDLLPLQIQPPTPSPTARLQRLAGDVSSALEFMGSRFGPPPLPTLTVSPIPGAFGQGFPGLVYLSTLSYLDPRDRPLSIRNDEQETFFSDILQAHETAHQWWGNVVTSSGSEDDWLMESLANYSALLFLENRRGPRVLDAALETYRTNLLAKRADGGSVESTGPLSWGMRLQSSQAPGAWRTIVYEKGSWVIHMLRRKLGDERFLSLLGELAKRYRFQPVTTLEFQKLAAEYVPKGSVDPKLENFFEQWVHGTGIPVLKVNYTVKGKAPNLKLTGTLVQTEAPEEFSVDVPIEVQMGRQKQVIWVKSSSEPVPWSLALRQAPSRVTLAPAGSVLAVRK